MTKKIRVDHIGGAATRDDGMLSIGVKIRGKVQTIEFAPNTVEPLTMALLASSRDPLGPLAKRFLPAGLSRFQVDDDVGISFLLGRDIAIHILLNREAAKALRHLLDTFDDPDSWDVSKVH